MVEKPVMQPEEIIALIVEAVIYEEFDFQLKKKGTKHDSNLANNSINRN
jgi:hypothetical protein